MKRSKNLNFYPEFWNGISGFLDDNKSLNEKVKAEISEELDIKEADIEDIKLANIFHQKASKYDKTWIVHPILVRVKNDKISLNWEAQNYKWVKMEDITKYKLLPGFDLVLNEIKKII